MNESTPLFVDDQSAIHIGNSNDNHKQFFGFNARWKSRLLLTNRRIKWSLKRKQSKRESGADWFEKLLVAAITNSSK